MLSLAEKLHILQNTTIGYKAPQDALFVDSNQQLLSEFKKLGVIGLAAEQTTTAAKAINVDIFCNVPGCAKTFDNITAYQTHYNSQHRHVCQECRRSMPTAHLLDLHLSEKHDSYFATLLERNKAQYACYLQDCNVKFNSEQARKDHCINLHKLPADFRYGVMHKQAHKAKAAQAKLETNADAMEVDAAPTKKQQKFVPRNICFGRAKEKMFTGSAHKSMDLQVLKDALPDI